MAEPFPTDEVDRLSRLDRARAMRGSARREAAYARGGDDG